MRLNPLLAVVAAATLVAAPALALGQRAPDSGGEHALVLDPGSLREKLDVVQARADRLRVGDRQFVDAELRSIRAELVRLEHEGHGDSASLQPVNQRLDALIARFHLVPQPTQG
jgi:hypothetical protein